MKSFFVWAIFCIGDSCRATPRDAILLLRPAPNAYSLPPALGTGLAPAFSISGRGKSPIDERVLNPGPGAYESGNQDKYKARSPSYSISSRTNIPTDQTQKPGPGAHSPEKVRLSFHLSAVAVEMLLFNCHPVKSTKPDQPFFFFCVEVQPVAISVETNVLLSYTCPAKLFLAEYF